MTTLPVGHSLILYDGVCGLCNRFVQFVLRYDPEGYYCFCSLQDPLAAEILVRHCLDSATVNTVCLVIQPWSPGEQLLLRSDASLAVLTHLGGGWHLVASMLLFVPRPLRDSAYKIVARIRYRLFGRLASCPLPPPAQRHRFIHSA